MKEKIGIYGDSFAAHNYKLKYTSWVTHIEKDYEIFNHARSATNLYYSYKEFIGNYKNYHKNIFIITEPFRFVTSRYAYGGFNNVEYLLNNTRGDFNKFDIRSLKSILHYIVNVLSDPFVKEQYQTYHLLMIEKIINTNANVLFVPAFPQPGDMFSGKSSLIDIFNFENNYWKKTRNYHDHRQCHLTEENNEILADHIKENLLNLKGYKILDINLDMYKEPIDIEKYR